MATDFERLLDLKERREQRAQSAARARRMALEQAARHVEDCRETAESYSRHILEHQNARYDALQKKIVGLGDVDEVREEIAAMRQKETALFLKIEEAEELRRVAAAELEEAKKALAEAVRNAEKFRELVRDEQSEAAVQRQMAEDKELEEFTPSRNADQY